MKYVIDSKSEVDVYKMAWLVQSFLRLILWLWIVVMAHMQYWSKCSVMI